MPYLTPQMRAMIRANTLAQMTDSCLIEREQNARGSMGQIAHTWETVASNVPCRLITSKGATLPATEVYANRVTMEDTYTISLPVGTDVSVDYRITVNNVAWRVANVVDGRTDAADVQAVLVGMRNEP